MPRLRSAALLTVCFCAAAVGCSSTSPTTSVPSSPIVAEFAGERLTLADFEEQYARSAGSRADAAADSLAAYEDFLRRYVDFRLKVREARRIGLDTDPEIVSEVQEYRDQLAAPYLLEREVMEGIVRDLYEKQQEEVKAAHVLLLVDRHAIPADTLSAYRRLEAIRDSMLTGALDFEQAARRHSDDPSRLRNGGDLGWFTGGRMILPFEEMAYETPVGDVSPVFRTQYGFHILKVSGRRPAAGEIRASHVLLRLSEASSQQDSAMAHAQLQELRARAEAGEPFAELAAANSQDPGSASRGGDLGYFTRDRMVEPFADAAFALENAGDLSGIVETDFGLHLIQLTDRRPPPTYEAQYANLKRLAEGLPRTRARRQEVGRTFREEEGTRLDSAAVRAAIAAYPSDSLLLRVTQDGFGLAGERPLASIGDSTITLDEFALALRGQRFPPSPNQEAQLFDLADQYLNERAVALATHRLEARDPEFRRVMQDFSDGVLLFRISEDSVWSAASRDSLGLRAFHAARAELYQYPERQRTIGFFSPSDSLLAEVARLLDLGHRPNELEDHLGRTIDAPAPLRIDTLYLSQTAEPPLDQALGLQPGERTQPARFRSQWVILVGDGVEPARPMTFEEAYALVVADYQDELDRRFVERLRSEAEMRLYPERLQMAFERSAATASSSSTPPR